MTWDELRAAAEAEGLLLRGGFLCCDDDGVPPLCDGRPALSLVLLGNAGGSLWSSFSHSKEFADGGENPLDRWSVAVISKLAAAFDARAVFPSDGPPYLPFQRWAGRAEGLQASPLGPLIHPQFGLWHAYRGALCFARRIEGLSKEPAQGQSHPCETCVEKPCLSACPVGAFSSEGYALGRCITHILSLDGADCMAHSCLARRACPVGRNYLYGADQSRFHMERFLEARLKEGENLGECFNREGL